jgi:CDP-diacylglycerol--glycerol-3-phosphate 3-phosphatidyltransferase
MTKASSNIYNVPNALTFSRLILALVVCALLHFSSYLSALIVFIVAASTDWVDGYWARKFDQVTKLGRVFDPFVDKVIICSVFIYLSSITESGIPAWASVIVIGRELLVTALRSAVEAAGGDFSASKSGKWKMVAQCIAAGASMLSLHQEQAVDWVTTMRLISLIVAIVLTIHSAVGYVSAAFRFLGLDEPSVEEPSVEEPSVEVDKVADA